MINAYPLQWPAGWTRTKSGHWKNGNFRKHGKWISVVEAIQRVLDELARMGIDRQDVVISTNVRTRLDGLPRSGEKEPDDSGVAVYWETSTGGRRVMAIDAYRTVADNLAAVAATLDAMRAIERHGGAVVLERAFTGFTALPAPGAKRTWREVMTFGESTPTREQLKQRYRELASIRHPDKGGNDAAMSELNLALADAEREVA